MDLYGKSWAYRLSDMEIKHSFIVQNIDYIANQAIPVKNELIMNNLLTNFLPAIDSKQELKQLQ